MTDSAPHLPPFQPDSAVRMPFTFDVAPLLAEVSALGATAWRAHFNTAYHDGGWSGIPLFSIDGKEDSLYLPRHQAQEGAAAATVQPTASAGRCPRLVAAIEALQCPVKSVRVLRLAAGAVIREHADDDLVWRDGEARLHIPLLTNDRVEFYVDGTRLAMQPGECWYLDLSKPHRVQNLGAVEHIHLVIDCGVNDWFEQKLRAGFSPVASRKTPGIEDGGQQFARFRELVFANSALQLDLLAATSFDAMLATAVGAGAANGLRFSVEDVRAHCNQARRDWIEQWIM